MKNNKKIVHKKVLDSNNYVLYNVLEAMTLFNYSYDIEQKLKEFMEYLEKNLYDDLINYGDIINQNLMMITTYEGK